MKTKREHLHSRRAAERGNALVYVLIAIVLFAALSLTLGRQTDVGEASGLDAEKAELYATQLIAYAADAKSAYDKMEFTGTQLANVNVIPPSDPDFNTAPNINKIYHPDGGGLNPGRIPDGATDNSAIAAGDPAPGWYLTFNNIDWTAPNPDLILVAYGLALPVCNAINAKIDQTLSSPPVMTDSIKETLIQKTVDGVDNYSLGANVDLTTGSGGICPACENRAALCVQEGGIYAFYSVIAER